MTVHLIRDSVPLRRGLIADPAGTHVRRMRQAVWLYLYLLLAVSPASGRRLLSPEGIAKDMGLAEATIRSWLGNLRKAGYIAVERQGALVRVKVVRWRREVEGQEHVPGSDDPMANGGLTAATLAQAVDADPSDPYWAAAVERVSEATLRELLDQAQAVPAAKIRKSREALLRYLLKPHLEPQ